MTNRKITYAVAGAVFLLSMLAPSGVQAKKTRLVAVSADVVEISGSLQSVKGFSWNQLFDFEEATIPGILSLGEFQRKTAVTTRLRLMETEGRAQVLSNPKIVTASGNQARITVGGRVPIPVVNNQGVGSQLEVSTVDYSRTVVIGTATAPSFTNRSVETHVELNSGETLVIGGLKSSARNVSEDRVPFLGRIPLIGLLFKNKDVTEEQRSLFLFITVEIVE